MAGVDVVDLGQMALHVVLPQVPVCRVQMCGKGWAQNCPANRDRTVEFFCGGLSEGRYEQWSVVNGQTKDIPRSSRLTTYPGWTAWGP
jgi:hypothetical protein